MENTVLTNITGFFFFFLIFFFFLGGGGKSPRLSPVITSRQCRICVGEDIHLDANLCNLIGSIQVYNIVKQVKYG